MSLKTDYKDYELAPSMGGQRHYRVTENADGTQSLTDVSEYLEIGDSFKAEDINATNSAVNDLANTPNDVTDLKMLGYTIPKEMPVKNYTDSNGVYHQRVGRRGLWECDWYYDYDGSVFYASNIIGTKNGADFICKGYSNCGYIAVNSMPNMSIQIRTNGTYLKNTSYADVTAFKNAMKQQGVYLYYELATEITIPIDGNEATTNQMLSDEWISGKIYAQGNFAIYKNKLWKSKVANNTGNTPAEGSYWTATNCGAELNKRPTIKTYIATFTTNEFGIFYWTDYPSTKIVPIQAVASENNWMLCQTIYLNDAGIGFRVTDAVGNVKVNVTLRVTIFYVTND